VDVSIPVVGGFIARFEALPPEAERFFGAEYGHLKTRPAPEAHVTVRYVDRLPEFATWQSLGPRAMLADSALVILDSGGRASIAIDERGHLTALVEPGMPIDVVRHRVVLPVLGLFATRRDAVIVHASATCGPTGAVLLLGEKGVGKSSVLAGLVARGHSYYADDRLLMTRQAGLLPLQGMLELRLDYLLSQPELGRAVRSTGWQQAHVARSMVRTTRSAASKMRFRFARRTAGALASLESALDAHCYFIDPNVAFATVDRCAELQRPHAFVVSHGTPESVAELGAEELRTWLCAEVDAAYRPLAELLESAARISPEWRAVREDMRARIAAIVSEAAGHMTATNVRTIPQPGAERVTDIIAGLTAAPRD